MAGRIAEADIDRVRTASDLVAIASERLTLRRTGRSYKGLCPFHDEKTPSFSINPESGLYYCFGCGVSGNVFHFVMALDDLGFPDAVEKLARRSGIQLTYEDESPADRHRRQMRPRLEEVLTSTVGYYHEQLLQGPDAVEARKYLADRGFGKRSADRFALGFAPGGWDALTRHLKGKGFLEDEMVEAGVALRSSRGGLVDQLRDRVVFPIHDPQGQPIAMAGRVLPDGEGPKYKNSPETALYKKSRTLYGLHWAKTDIVANDLAIVVEGYTDVMGLHLAGATTAVASCGTALGEDHLRVLKRFTRHVVLMFDGDVAGSAATERVFGVAGELGLDIRVARLPEGKDPYDVARGGSEAIDAVLAGQAPLLEFKVEAELAAVEMDSAEGEARALDAGARAIATHPDSMVRRTAARRLARRLRDVTDDMVVARVEQFRDSGATPRVPHRIAVATGTDDRSMGRHPGPARPPQEITARSSPPDESPPATVVRLARTDEAALLSLLQAPGAFLDAAPEVSSDWFSPGPARDIAAEVLIASRSRPDPNAPIDVHRCGVSETYQGIVRRLAVEDAGGFGDVVPWVDDAAIRSRIRVSLEDFAVEAAWALYRAFLDRCIEDLQRSLRDAEARGDADSVRHLDSELVAFIEWRQNLGTR